MRSKRAIDCLVFSLRISLPEKCQPSTLRTYGDPARAPLGWPIRRGGHRDGGAAGGSESLAAQAVLLVVVPN